MIDIVLFKNQYKRFKENVFKNSGVEFKSFSSNPYTELEEGYKYDIYRDARKLLRFETWKESDIGNVDIARSVINAIELPSNNLVQWQSKYGDEKRPHHILHYAISNALKIKDYDSVFYSLYRESDDAKSFSSLIKLFGRKYSLIAYLLFIKDRSRYTPIAPQYFDQAFLLLGVEFSTNKKCSWDNYSTFNNILLDLKGLLTNELQGEVSLLDAHSFAWIIARKIEEYTPSKDELKYLKLSEKERQVIVKARNGQGFFRDVLLKYWQNACAVTGCKEKNLLRASHIKPWSECDLEEAIDSFNGLLLSPTLDAAFDKGFITFDTVGNILISPSLSNSDAKILGLSSSLRLKNIDFRHKPYLVYHNEFIFREN